MGRFGVFLSAIDCAKVDILVRPGIVLPIRQVESKLKPGQGVGGPFQDDLTGLNQFRLYIHHVLLLKEQ